MLQGPRPTAGNFEVQIGAFASTAEADRALEAARAAAGPLLQAYSSRTLTTAKDARQLHRARFAGFEQKAAGDVCLELRRRRIDCFVARAE